MKKLLVISSVWVEPNSSAAGSRMLQLLECFSEEYVITYVSTAGKSDQAFDLNELNVVCKTININDPEFDELLLNIHPDIVLFDRFIIEEQFGWRVAEKLPQTLRVLDTEDLHCLRKAREIALKENKEFDIESLLTLDITKREIASIFRCDLSLIISNYEMDLLRNTFKIDERILHYIPFLVDPIIEQVPGYEERKDFYFVGNFLHQPNVDAVLYLKNEIWNNIKEQLPETVLHIYGAYMPEKIKQLHNEGEGFLVKGKEDNLTERIRQHRICLAPLRFGAGLKGKLLEAMQNGTPNVTTTIGAEGMQGNSEWSGSIADKTEDIIKNTVELYSNKVLWLKAQHNGVSIVNQLFNKREYSELLIQRMEQIKEDITTHRNKNFLGELLQHHTLQSTKYLSKWIEEKNRN